MTDSEDDYLSDKLLIACDVRPGLLYHKRQKRNHKVYKKQQEDRTKKPISYQERENERRDKGLSTVISSDNKGFKLLEKMGYKAGTGLGKSGITEPVAIKLKHNSAGIGRESHLQEVVQKKQKSKERSFQTIEEEFRLSNAERRYLSTLQSDYKKAQRTCEELDLQSGIQVPQLPFFWSKETQKLLKKKDRTDSEDQEEDEEEEVFDVTCEPKLCDILMYLRKEYRYCMYCADYIEQGVVSSCPGYFRKEHDD